MFRITSTGQVGIGIVIPDAKLHVDLDSPTANEFIFKLSTSDDTQRFAVDEDGDIFADGGMTLGSGLDLKWGGNGARIVGNTATEVLQFLNSGGEYARFDASGQLGLNTTTPQNTLNVVGDANITGDLFIGGNITTNTGGTIGGNATCMFLFSPAGTSRLEICD